MNEQKTIVVSAVNIVVGGTLTILRDCLAELSKMCKMENLRVIALVNNKNLAYYDNIEYIEIPWAKKCWVNRLWTEYVIMKKISKTIQPIHLWLSLHDTTPAVVAQHRAVYCHNSFPFYKWSISDIWNNYRIVLFSLFSKNFIYKKNIHKNDYVIVQQSWFKDEFIKMFDLAPQKLIIARPPMEEPIIELEMKHSDNYVFFFPSSLSVHKNFELACKAAEILNKKNIRNFELLLTIDGTTGKYDRSIVNKYKSIASIKFIGFQSREKMLELYGTVDCLLFPSKVETWGLPISEFLTTGKPMLLSDLNYAHATSEGSKQTAFFDPNNAEKLATMMARLINNDNSFLKPVPQSQKEGLYTSTWNELLSTIIRN